MITISSPVTIAGAHVRCIVYAPRTDVHRKLMRFSVHAANEGLLGERSKSRLKDGKAHQGRCQLDHISKVRSSFVLVHKAQHVL